MLSIFRKNIYLIDLIGGLTDFHNHILPGIDDGAETLQESIDLIKRFQNFGIHNFVATPHIMNDYYPNTPDTIKNSYDILKSHLPESVSLNYAAEYMMDQHFIEIIENKNLLPITKNKILVEMSYFQPPINLNQILFKLQNNSFAPILAHPERYSYWHSKEMEEMRSAKSRGCEFQLNMLSLSSHYGIGIQKMAYKLLENNQLEYIGSDCHKLSHIEKIKTIKISSKHLPYLDKIIENTRELFIN